MLKLKPRKTVEDYLRLPEDARAELIEGEIFMTPTPYFDHQKTVFEIAARLREFVVSRSLGEVAIAPLDVHLPSGDIVEPDVIYVSNTRRAIIQDWIRGSPDLLVEVLSTSHTERDRIVKRDLYARNGVPEYWIADPAARTLEVFRLEGNTYASYAFFEPADVASSPMFPGLVLPLAAIFPSPAR